MKDDDIDFLRHSGCEVLHNAVPGFEAICRRWSLIALGSVGGAQAILRHHSCANIPLLDALGINYNNDEGSYDRMIAEQSIKKAYQVVMEAEPIWPEESPLLKNIHWLSRVLGLNRTEIALLTLVILERQDTVLSQALDTLGALNNSRLYDALCQLLRVTEMDIRTALSPRSRLFRTGLLRLDGRIYAFEHKIDLIGGLSEKMISSHSEPFGLFANSFITARGSFLKVNDYDYLNEDIRNLQNFLRGTISLPSSGINILVYGPPGTGKTELVRMLAQDLDASMFEIATESENGDRLTQADRLGSYQLSQHVLCRAPRAVLLFDEVEDVFSAWSEPDSSREGLRLRGNDSGRKAWINKLLEENSVPTFWLTNNIADIDPAHMRRFSYHLNVKIPPRSVRERILGAYAKPLGLSEKCIRQLADQDSLPPAVIEKSSSVAKAILNVDSRANMEKVMSRLIFNSMRALGNEAANLVQVDNKLDYDTSHLHTKCNLHGLVEGIRSTGSARVCLYGPPGTGKTAFAHHLARELDLPLLVRRASDILGSFVGQTERNIAAAFEQAQEENAILLLDEVDSFLMDRGGATRTWEITGVNEMLTQMESFDGIFIASTNLLDQMDAASLRRFDTKILFDFLQPTQALNLFRKACAQLDLQPNSAAEEKVGRLSILTPGDFAAVLRQSRLVKFATADEVAESLIRECALKPQGRQKMGF
jgi:transitional endoplasmic reticulum ATPase